MAALDQVIFFLSTIHTWIIIVSLGTFFFFLYHARKFRNKFMLYSYLLFIMLFVAESIKNLYIRIFGLSFWLRTPNFIFGLFVIVFFIYLVYYYYSERFEITQIFDMNASLEDVSEFEGEVDLDDVEEGFIHLLKSETSDYGFKLLREAATESPGACFTRKSPKKLMERYKFEGTPITWLRDEDDVEGDYNIVQPMRTNFLKDTILDFAEKNEGAVILLEGLEYLVVKNSFEKILRFVQDLSDELSTMDNATLIISINPKGFSNREFALLEEEVDIVLEP